MTSLVEEQAEQRRWTLRPHCSAIKGFDRLVENEFVPPELGDEQEADALRRVVKFAVARVPYYRDLFARLRLTADDIRSRHDLPRLPLLTKRELRESFVQLRAESLPPGDAAWGITSSSGSTGPPTKVLHTVSSNTMFTFLSQRNSRWFRHDARRTMAWIRSAAGNPTPRPGTKLADGETLRLSRWRYVGVYFETGPSVYLNFTTPVDAQVAWLRQERPDYLLILSHSLEHLAMACAGERPCDSLRVISALSEPLTPTTRRYIEAIYGAPVRQAYGLNEIGLVAVRCEAGRYHVHREHCLVEIIDDLGQPCRPARLGRVVVTGLGNAAMPLIRYDTDDLATVTEGPCPCGRTLPSFGEIHGRYSRIVNLPDGTLERVAALRTALQQLPKELVAGLRRYQIYQFKDGRFELQLVSVSPIPQAFFEGLHQAWAASRGDSNQPLTVRSVAEIPYTTAGNKFEDFVSEYVSPQSAQPLTLETTSSNLPPGPRGS